MTNLNTSVLLLPAQRTKLEALSRQLGLSQSQTLRLLVDQAQIKTAPVEVTINSEKNSRHAQTFQGKRKAAVK